MPFPRLVTLATWALTMLTFAPDARAAQAITHVPVAEASKPAFRDKVFGTYTSPDKRATLIWSSDDGSGDFPQSKAFVQAGKHLYDLGAYRSLTHVTWSKDSRTVTFEANRLAGYGKDDICVLTYRVGDKTCDRRVLKQVDDQPSG